MKARNRQQGMQKPLTPFEQIFRLANFLTTDERIALIKLLSVNLGLQRVYTHSEVLVIVQQEISRHEQRKQMDQLLVRSASNAVQTRR